MRKFLITAASAACMVAVVGMAPSAVAANESAQLSSLDAGVSISGSASSTVTADTSLGTMLVQSNFFSALHSSYTSVSCVSYGMSLTINGSPQAIACAVGTQGPAGYVYVELSPVAVRAGSVVTLTWGPGLLTSTGSLSGPTIEVKNASLGGFTFVTVTPTLASSSSSAGEAAPVLMWQQAYGRASATDSCQDGYTPTWDTWPNSGAGGFVCNRFVPEYGN
jgi:hypothetical protein